MEYLRGQVRTIGASRGKWLLVRDGVTDTVTLAQPTVTTTQPANSFTTDNASGMRIRFGGTAAANKNFSYQVVLWYGHHSATEDQAWVPHVVAKGDVTLGSATYGSDAAGLGASGNLFADAITEELGYPGTRITEVTVNTPVVLEVATQNALRVEVQLDLDGAGTAATTMDVFVQLGEFDAFEAGLTGDPFTFLVDSSALGSALTDPAPANAKDEVIGTAAHGVLNCRGKSVARLMFGGTTTDGDIFNYQVILWSQVTGPSTTAPVWMPRVIANGAITLGADVYSATGAGVGASTSLFVDTITDTVLDGASIYNTTNLRAVLRVPLLGAERIEVQTDKTTGDTADVFCQLSDDDGGALAVSDVQIGAVEIKDHDGTDRAAVDASNQLAVADATLSTAAGRTAFLHSVGKGFSDIETIAVNAADGTPQALKVANAGDVVYLMGCQGNISAAGTLTFTDTTPADLTGAMPLPTRGSLRWDPISGPYVVSAEDKGLSIAAVGGVFDGVAQILVVTP